MSLWYCAACDTLQAFQESGHCAHCGGVVTFTTVAIRALKRYRMDALDPHLHNGEYVSWDELEAVLASSSTPTRPLAQQFFDHCHLEMQLDEELMAIFGATARRGKTMAGTDFLDTDVETWPCEDITYDDYDQSFELHGCRDTFAPTHEQIRAALALGFARCWFCYPDGTERYIGGERIQKGHARTGTRAIDSKRRRDEGSLSSPSGVAPTPTQDAKPCYCGTDVCIGQKQLRAGFRCVREAGLAALSSSRSAAQDDPFKVNECINCGDREHGAYSHEDGPGPFCDVCWGKLCEGFAAIHRAADKDYAVLALKNYGADIDCGACMEIAFVGVTTNVHTCQQGEELRKGYAILFDDGPEAIEARICTELELPTDRENAAHLRKRQLQTTDGHLEYLRQALREALQLPADAPDEDIIEYAFERLRASSSQSAQRCLCGMPAVTTVPMFTEGYSLFVCDKHAASLGPEPSTEPPNDQIARAFIENIERYTVGLSDWRLMRIFGYGRQLAEAELRRASSFQSEPPTWQPIETAPRTKRGVVVDLWCVTEDHESAKFYFMQTMSGVKDQKRWHGRVSECVWRDYAWRPANGLTRHHRLEVEPTHWMPLPDPPSLGIEAPPTANSK